MKDVTLLLAAQRAFYETGQTKEVSYRIEKLRHMAEWIVRNESKLMTALKADLGKAPFEAYATELGIVLDEIKHTLKHLRRWTADRRVLPPLKQFPCRCFVRPEPYGVALIMSPWNYPFQLTVAPLAAAVAAGNCAVVKPSAYSPHTSAAVAAMISEVFEEGHVAVVEGGRKENEALLAQRYDYIFFTGSVGVGKTVMAAAAKTLTPVTLELGGKSPCIVDKTADIALAAKRIAWGKFINAGQTCVAPDYVLVHTSVKQALMEGIMAAVHQFYGEDPCANDEYPKIINRKHFDRLMGLTEGEHLLCGGSNADTLKIAPTLIDGARWDSPVMREEIFGPILPIITYEKLGDVIRQVNARPKPLALYVFTRCKRVQVRVLNEISFGGGCVNDTVVHLATPHMPFGGVGESGMGAYHGKAGFDTFTHYKSILSKSLLLDIPLRYPPYKNHLALLKRI